VRPVAQLQPSERREPFTGICAALLFILVAVAFLRSAGGEFLSWDDDINITGNPHLRTLSADSIKWMFTDASHMRRYVPLTWLDWALEYRWFGLTAHSSHVGNILFHAANGVLVFFAVRALLTAGAVPDRHNRPITLAAAVGALFWALHPLRVEVVAWASGRIYCQAIGFLLLALLSYLHAVRSPHRPRWLAVSVLAFAASLLTYPLALGFGAVLLVIDASILRRLRLDRSTWRDPESRAAWLEKIPYLLVAAAVVITTVVARYNAQGLWEPPPTLAELGLSPRVMRAFYLWAYYGWKPLAPVGLAPVYTTLVWFEPWAWRFVLSAMAVVGITAVLIWQRRRMPRLLALWACHLLLLVPMLGLTEQPHYPNDRYSYLEGLVWAVGIGGLVAWVGVRRVWIPLTLILAAFATLSVVQIGIWRDSEILFRHLLQHVGENRYRADIAMRLAEVLRTRGRLAEAEPWYRESLRIEPDGKRAAIPHLGLGRIAVSAGRRPEAAEHYREAMRLQPDFAPAYLAFGELVLEAGQAVDAVTLLKGAVALDPSSAAAHQLLGVALLQTGQTAAAVDELQTAIRLEPGSAQARCNLAAALTAANRPAEAAEESRIAVRLNPRLPDAYANLGDALQASGNLPEAITALREAVRLKPDLANAQNGLGAALAMSGRPAEAVPAFQAATRAKPDFVLAHYNLGLALRDSGQRDAAIVELSTVLRLNPGFTAARRELEALAAK
jgi:protein O-mannosyl-transferase